MTDRRSAYDALAVIAASLVLLLSLVYVYFNPDFDATTLMVGVLFPLAFGCIVLASRKNGILLFTYLAFFWSLIDDKPVQFDSVLTWPEVTRFHPAGPHIFMEVVLHVATAVFLLLAVREALKGTTLDTSKVLGVALFTLSAFILCYAQNIPLDAVQSLATQDWFPLDLIEHAASLVAFWFAIREATRLKR